MRWLDLSGNVLDTQSDDIILDVNAPVGSVQVTPGVAASDPDATTAQAPYADAAGTLIGAAAGSHTVYLPLARKCQPPLPTGPANVTLHLAATDDVSGVGGMTISNIATFSCADWEPYATRKAWHVPSGTTTVYVRFRDNAGNVSATVSDAITL